MKMEFKTFLQLTVVLLTSATMSPASAAAVSPPRIVSFTVSTPSVPYSGGGIAVSGDVREATSCIISVKPAIRDMASTVSCAHISLSVLIPASSKATYTLFLFTLTAKNGRGKASASVPVSVSPFPEPQIVQFSVSPSAFGSDGGEAQLSTATNFASNCTVAISPRVKGWPSKQSCSGSVNKVVLPPTKSATTYSVTYTVKGPSGTATKSAVIGVGVLPRIIRVQASSKSLPSIGGKVNVDVSVELARNCQIEVSASLGSTLTTLDCTATTVSLPRNTSTAPAPYNITVNASNPTGVARSSTTVTVAAREIPAGLVQSAATGDDHTCAVVVGGRVACWGSNSHGQLGDGSFENSLTPVWVEGSRAAKSIAVGGEFSCQLDLDQRVACWGAYDGADSLAPTDAPYRNVPTPLSSLTDVASIAAGYRHACALLKDGHVMCWGSNDSGQLGDTTYAERRSPVPVSGISSATALSLGVAHSCALMTDGRVMCWGNNDSGQLGDGTHIGHSSPVPVSGINGAISVSTGDHHSCALLTDQRVLCWGANFAGQLGNGTYVDSSEPTDLYSHPWYVMTVRATAIEAGGAHTCALVDEGLVSCWGNNYFGGLGNGHWHSVFCSPQLAGGVSGVVAISAAGQHTCFVLSDGRLICVGDNSNGQLGNGATSPPYEPSPVVGFGP